MKILWRQLKFDSQRLVVRNLSFQFFSIVMPAGFYLLFTRVMVTGTGPEMTLFRSQYMCSMIVYSGMINALMGIAELMMHDREQGLLRWLQLTPSGVRPYYVSVGLLSMGMNLLAVTVLGSLAVLINGVALSASQWLLVAGLILVGQLPVILMGVLLSFVNRAETLSVLSNLITFPMAILSGLWWPLKTLPSWIQPVGKLMPTYFVNDLLGHAVTNGTLPVASFFGMAGWISGLLLMVVGFTHYRLKRGGGIVQA